MVPKIVSVKFNKLQMYSQEDLNKIEWWNFLSLDNQIWLMLCAGFSTPLKTNEVKNDEKIKMYNLYKDKI